MMMLGWDDLAALRSDTSADGWTNKNKKQQLGWMGVFFGAVADLWAEAPDLVPTCLTKIEIVPDRHRFSHTSSDTMMTVT